MARRDSAHLGTSSGWLTVGVGETEESKAASGLASFPAPHLLHFSVLHASLPARWRPAPLHRRPPHPLHPLVCSPSRSWSLVTSFHRSLLIPSLPLTSPQLSVQHRSSHLSQAPLMQSCLQHGEGKRGEGRVTLSLSHTFHPEVFWFLVFEIWYTCNKMCWS